MKDEEMAEEQKLCIKAQGFKEDVKAHDIDVINAVENKLDAYKVGRYDGFLAGLKAGRPQWHEANEIQCYEDIPNNKNKLYVWVVNIAKFEKDKPILETRVGDCDLLEYDIMAHHLIKWCEIPTFDKK